jgi:hypothetical protein
VPGEELLEGGEGVGGDVEGGDLHVLEEVEEVLRVEDNLGESLEADTLAQHCPAVQGNLLMFIACTKGQQINIYRCKACPYADLGLNKRSKTKNHSLPSMVPVPTFERAMKRKVVRTLLAHLTLLSYQKSYLHYKDGNDINCPILKRDGWLLAKLIHSAPLATAALYNRVYHPSTIMK